MHGGDNMDSIDTSTKEGKLLKIAIMRLTYLYKDKTASQILKMLEDAANQFD